MKASIIFALVAAHGAVAFGSAVYIEEAVAAAPTDIFTVTPTPTGTIVPTQTGTATATGTNNPTTTATTTTNPTATTLPIVNPDGSSQGTSSVAVGAGVAAGVAVLGVVAGVVAYQKGIIGGAAAAPVIDDAFATGVANNNPTFQSSGREYFNPLHSA